MPGRTTEGGTYRYGFNGKETDQETGIQDYGMRWYLPNIARFPSVDPLTESYPFYTPYQFASNNPQWFMNFLEKFRKK
jgi:RHS repeat-associated protein